jgi:c-di-GMP-binding flagellar brake protein YcgR
MADQTPQQPTREDDQPPLEAACARNVPLELHSVSQDRTIPAARARMIDLDDRHVYLEKPQIIGRNVRLSAGQRFAAYFSYNDVIFEFRCQVVETRAAVRLNRRKLVEGLVITRPSEVSPGQRRQFFRTTVAAREPIPARIQPAPDGERPEPDEHAPWLEARLVDASAGGFGLRVDDPNYSRFRVFHNYFVRFGVPESGREIVTLCELRQVRPIQDGAATRLGMLLLPWPTQARLNSQLQPLLAYLTKLQRTRLAG